MLITDSNELRAFKRDQRIWQGIPGIEVTKSGRVFSCFYSGKTKETLGNYCMIVKSDDGKNFSEPIAAAYYDEKHRCFDPCLWIDPLGRLWFTWSVIPDNALYGAICENPDADELIWGKEFFIGHDVMMNKPLVLSTGEWLFPIAVWDTPWLNESWRNRREAPGAFVYITRDNGKTFEKLGGCGMPNRSFDEHMVVEMTDGRLMMWVRTMYGIGVTYSWDYGENWCAGANSGVASPSSRFFLSRLKSGRLLLVNHKNFKGRNNLTAMLSDDDGATWSEGLLLDEREDVSYPDAKEADDGFIYITYDRERGCFKGCIEDAAADAREILYAKVTEEDILRGKVFSRGSGLKLLIDRLGDYKGPEKNPYELFSLYSEREAARKLLREYRGADILKKLFDEYPIEGEDIELLKKTDDMIDELIVGEYCNEVLLAEIIKNVRGFSKVKTDVKDAVSKIKKAVLNSAHGGLNYDLLVAECKMSRHFMCRLFRDYTGTTIGNFYSKSRLAAAKTALVNTAQSLEVIAIEAGYENVSDLTEALISDINMTSMEYRKIHGCKG